MKIIAITGSIGCGKTFLANIIRSLGYVVYDADKWVKYLYYRSAFLNVIKQFNLVEEEYENIDVKRDEEYYRWRSK